MRRRAFLRAAGAATLLAQRVPAAGKQYLAYWGTYTTSLPRFANGESKGIYVSRLNSETGKSPAPNWRPRRRVRATLQFIPRAASSTL